jgi:hypothetical protein
VDYRAKGVHCEINIASETAMALNSRRDGAIKGEEVNLLDQTLDDRLVGVLARLHARPLNAEPPSADREHRLARARILDEIPRLLLRLSSAIAELNDRIADDNVWITLAVAERTPSTEAMFTLSVEGRVGDGVNLVLNVDYAGRLTMILARDGKRSLIKASTIFEADRALLLEGLIELLEAHFPHLDAA